MTGDAAARGQLEALFCHLLQREFADVPDAADDSFPLQARVVAAVREFAQRQARLVAAVVVK